MLEAVKNGGISKIREAVPEFEATFQEELRAEDGELGAFQATSLFARWVGERIHGGDSDDASRRAFQAVEDLITDRDVELGDELAAEFIEALWNAPDAHALMGPRTRERASASG